MDYYLHLEGEGKGPYTLGQLRSMWNAGTITSETLYSRPGFEKWFPLGRMRDELEPEATIAELPPDLQPAFVSRLPTPLARKRHFPVKVILIGVLVIVLILARSFFGGDRADSKQPALKSAPDFANDKIVPDWPTNGAKVYTWAPEGKQIIAAWWFESMQRYVQGLATHARQSFTRSLSTLTEQPYRSRQAIDSDLKNLIQQGISNGELVTLTPFTKLRAIRVAQEHEVPERRIIECVVQTGNYVGRTVFLSATSLTGGDYDHLHDPGLKATIQTK